MGENVPQRTPQEIALPTGSGYWGVQLVAGASISNLERKLPGLIGRLIVEGEFRREIYGQWPRDELNDLVAMWSWQGWVRAQLAAEH